MTRHNCQRDIGVMECLKFDCLLRHIDHTRQLLKHSHTNQQGDPLVQEACSQQEHCLSHGHRENMAREFFLAAPGPNRKVSLSGTTSTVVAASSAQFQTSQTSEFHPGCGRMQCRLHRVVAHRSLSCDKKVETGNGGDSWVTCSSVSSQLTTFTLAGQSLSSFQWPGRPHFARGSLCLSL